MKIDIKVNTRAIVQEVGKASSQVRFGIARGLTRTASDVRDGMKKEMGRVFDRPTPWLTGGMFVTKATKAELSAVDGFKGPDQSGAAVTPAQPVHAEIEGGARSPKRFDRALQTMGLLPAGWVTVPGRVVPRDSFGNVEGNYLRKLLRTVATLNAGPAMPNRGQRKASTIRRQGGVYFVVRVGGRPPGLSPGIYMREIASRSPLAIMLFKAEARYQPRLNFEGVARAVVGEKIEANLADGVREAMATAR